MTGGQSCDRSGERQGNYMAEKYTREVYKDVLVDADDLLLYDTSSAMFKVFDVCELMEKLDAKCVTITIEYSDPLKSSERWECV